MTTRSDTASYAHNPSIPFKVQARVQIVLMQQQKHISATVKQPACKCANVQMCNYNILRAILKWSRHGALVNKQTKGRPLPAKIYEIFGETSKSGKIPKKRGGGGQRLFGVSLKIHPFWWAEASLRED